MSANVLVTGGCGFIGSHVVGALVDRGDQVRVLDNLSSGRLENIAEVSDQVDLVQGDLRDVETVARAVRRCEGVVHLGALPSVLADRASSARCSRCCSRRRAASPGETRPRC